MAETLSYENAPETEVLSPEEQDSLEVGEKLIAEQEGLLAGKYNSPKELEKAYLELQSKFGRNLHLDSWVVEVRSRIDQKIVFMSPMIDCGSKGNKLTVEERMQYILTWIPSSDLLLSRYQDPT